jgi:hypothetical protein
VVMTSVAASIVSVRLAVRDSSPGLLESVTLKVSGVPVTAAVGVPPSAPVDAFRDSPAGSVPLVMDQVYGVVPPIAARVVLYAEPTCPFGSEEVVITRAAEEIVRVKLTDWEAAGVLESVTLNVSGVLATATVGVPVMAPVAAFRVNPVGKVPLVSDQA